MPDGATPTTPTMFAVDELFYRDLSEVHLLIDFISGRADRSLAGLKDVCTADAEGNAASSMTPQQVVGEICKISYPPDGNKQTNANQAAFMLIVKDRLNYLATPARGLTVAFTSMFAGVSLSYPNRLWALLGKLSPLRVLSSADDASPEHIQHFSARAAYPNLEEQARAFRGFYDWLPFAALVLVAFIAFTNWDISVTSGVLNQMSVAEKDYAELLKKDKTFVPTAAACAAPALVPAQQLACETAAELRNVRQASRDDLCNLIGGGLLSYMRPVAVTVRIFGGARYVAAPAADEAITKLRLLIEAVIQSLSGIVIPVAFGALGTLAGLLRSITSKMRDSILAPRDYGVARVSIFLGMTAGLAVGLFDFGDIAKNGGDTMSGVGGTITYTAAALSFATGFASEAFFSFLDGLIARLLPPPPSPSVGPPS